MTAYTQTQVIEMLRRQIALRRTQKAMAAELGISQAYLSDIIHGRRAPGQAVLALLGLEERYVPVKKSK